MEIIQRIDNIDYIELKGVYPVLEDTLLLVKAVHQHLEVQAGRIMDMGCGVGLISLLSCQYGWETVSVDREPIALKNLRMNLEMNGFRSKILLSDLFEGIPRSLVGSFDLITFNPPYLSSLEGCIDRRSDLALIGGEKGHEVMKRFIERSSIYLNKNGKVMLLGYAGWYEDIDQINTDLSMDHSKNYYRDIDGEKFTVFTLFKG